MSDKIRENISAKDYGDQKRLGHDFIKKMLEEAGIQNYDPQVIMHLADYINNYAKEVLNHAVTFATHAERKSVNMTDVKLAVEVMTKKSSSKRLSQKELVELAREHNQTQLPDFNFAGGLPLPSEGTVLTNCNYKLKSPTPQVQNYPVNISLMDIQNRQNQIVTLNSMKNHPGSIPTVIRTSSGTMAINVPLNLTSQRIILKPQIPTHNNTLQSKIDDNVKKRLKLEEIKK